ncbi:YfgM family protein [Photobacterium damselae subsp. piscicida]|nr:YfgM family protein [Photobacterium damselae subsp. piscicida]
MNDYATEEQQVEAIKSWWTDNGKAVVIGAVIGLGGLWGWRYYQGEVQAGKEQASNSYTQVMAMLESGKSDAIADTQAFIQAHKDSHYSVLAALQLAKAQIVAKDLNGAAEQLKWVAANSTDQAILPLAKTRLARVYLQQDKYDEALAELKTVKMASWKAKVDELRGDVLLKKGDTDAARDAYIEAQEAGANSPVLRIKLDNLAQ